MRMMSSRVGIGRARRDAPNRKVDRPEGSRHATASLLEKLQVLRPALLFSIALALAPGCAGKQPTNESIPDNDALAGQSTALAQHLAATATEAPPIAPGGLRVRLAFSAAADLDLYVTDPSFETVYFANSPNLAGGRLEADVRCDAVSPRVETILFPAILPGVYRVGVDFPQACEGGASRTAFAVQFEGRGVEATHQGRINKGHFLPVVLEVTASQPEAH
jgi:hypothetical protein